MNLRPTLIIGVGSSGLKIVENVQKLMYEHLGINSLTIYKYLYIETNHGVDVEETPLGSDIIPIRPYVKSVKTSVDILKGKGFNLDWIPDRLEAKLASINAGAGGVRPGGRLSLWDCENFTMIFKAIQNAFNEITLPASIQNVDQSIVNKSGGRIEQVPVIFVVGTLVGGTNSGMFIDLGYIIREITGMREGGALYGIFSVPPDAISLPAGYANTFGALNEVEFFRNDETTYQEEWPNGNTATSNLPPYAIVYLVSQDYNDPKYGRIKDLRGLYKMMGFQLFCNLVGMSSYRTSVLVDGMNAGFGFYSTYGISSITYPKYSISENVACMLGIELCDRWLDVNNYIDLGNVYQVLSEPTIKTDANVFFDKELHNSIMSLGSRPEGEGLSRDIEKDVDKIMKKQLTDPFDYLLKRYSSSGSEGYYAIVNSNLKLARDHLIEKILQKIIDLLNEKQNLKYVEYFLEGLKDSIDENYDFWRADEVPEKGAQWNSLLTQELRRLQLNTYSFIGEKREVLESRLQNLLEKLNKHLMIGKLMELKENIPEGDMVSSINSGIKLPCIRNIRDMRACITEIKNRLEKRKKDIAGEIADETIPIYRVWHDGSFSKDCNVLLSQFKQQKTQVVHYKDITQEDLWPSLLKKNENIFELIKRAYQKEAIGYCPNVNVINEAISNIPISRIYAERTISSLLRLVKGGGSGPGVPRFVIGNNLGGLKNLIKELNDKGFTEFGQDHIQEIQFLENTIVFYDEKSQVNPHDDLVIKNTIRNNFENPPKDKTGKDTVEKEVWKSFRTAFNIKKLEIEFKSEKRIDKVKDMINIIRDFCLEWQQMPDGKWKPSGRRYLDGFQNIDTEDPPVCRITIPGKVERDWKLVPDDPHLLQSLAKAEEYFEKLKKQVIEALKKKGLQEIVNLFNQEIKPRLKEQFDIEVANRKAEYYFGIKDDGLVQRILKEKI